MQQGFSAQEASRLTNCTQHQLRYWDQVGLVKPSVQQTGGRPGVRRLYSFRDLVSLRCVRSLLDNGMSVQRVRRTWDYLRREGRIDDQLADVRLVTDGSSIFEVTEEGEVLDALRNGQLAFFVTINEVTKAVPDDSSRFELDRDRFLSVLSQVREDVLSEVAEASGG